MAQSAAPQKGAKLRRNLISVSIVLGVALAGVVVLQAILSSDFREKMLLSVVDKLVLGGVIVFVGYLVQKQLEVFKRDQALASEVAKARIAAYHRVFAAVASLDYTNTILWAGFKAWRAAKTPKDKQQLEKELGDIANKYQEKFDALRTLIAAERFLLGEDFARAASKFTAEIRATVSAALEGAPEGELPDASEYERRTQERRRLLDALVACLPPFARAPVGDLHFSTPDFYAVYAEITAKEQLAPKKEPAAQPEAKKEPGAQPAPPTGAAP